MNYWRLRAIIQAMAELASQSTIEIAVFVDFAPGSGQPTGIRVTGRSLTFQKNGLALSSPEAEMLKEADIFFWLTEAVKNIGLLAMQKPVILQ